MKKNKKVLNIILVICLVIIWGFIGKRLFFMQNNETDIVVVNDQPFVPEKDTRVIKKDTFEFTPLERDPFGKFRYRKVYSGSTKPTNKSSSKTNTKITKTVTKAKRKEPWPKIGYYGYVKGGKSTGELIVIKVDSKVMKVRQNVLLDGNLQITTITRDSIIVKRDNESRIIKRN